MKRMNSRNNSNESGTAESCEEENRHGNHEGLLLLPSLIPFAISSAAASLALVEGNATTMSTTVESKRSENAAHTCPKMTLSVGYSGKVSDAGAPLWSTANSGGRLRWRLLTPRMPWWS